MSGADFKISFAATVFAHTGVKLVKRILNVFFMVSFFFFVFLQKMFLTWKPAWCCESSQYLCRQNPSLRSDVCAFDASQLFFLIWRRLGLSRRFFGPGSCGVLLRAEISSRQTRPVWEMLTSGWRERLRLEILQGIFGGMWRSLRFPKEQKEQRISIFYKQGTECSWRANRTVAQSEKRTGHLAC